ncbi:MULTISPECIES: sigma-54 dependent transcriptional regulator [Ferrimonas]|uniref:sigma-54-dependent transcriptional regulator n=1 Tax=Ferrimonas TaxID=44011 RepID=UPI0003FDE345|nr:MULTISPECIES: sigma-54 dependent transcriptional regulator [Ferrimonas]USD38955.1 sigma-54-dependent Fis family transcriptional regulator [Ferrimonas sp. SCSIO 43195]
MKLARNLLLVDDESQWLRTLSMTLNRLVPEANVDTCVDSRQVMNRLDTKDYALVLLDLTMPFHSGEELLESIRNQYPNTRVIIVTGVNEVDTAVRCMKRGAYDYFIKTGDVDDLAISVRRALEVVGLERSYQHVKDSFLTKELSQPQAFNHILTCEPAMLDRLRYLEALAISPEPILITGESGSGKDQFAKALHLLSCADAPFVSINLAGLNLSTIEATLFGQIRGALGADEPARAGLVHSAADGVLYLDEIGDLPLEAQSKLLDLLQHRQYYPLGSDRPQPVRCRIVASTQHDLLALKQAGKFRNDLLYRLRSHRINLPPLRDRPLDLTMLINHFIEMAANEMQRTAPLQPRDLADKLRGYQFPGNLQELKGMVFDAVSRSDDTHLNVAPFLEAINELNGSAAPIDQQLRFPDKLPTLAEAGKALIDEAMSRTANNQTAAAQMLGISQSALSRRIAKGE